MQRQTVALLWFVCVLFLTGVACGALLVHVLDDAQQQDVSAYVERHVRSFLPDQERVPLAWSERTRAYVQWFVVIVLCGVSVVFTPIVCLIVFIKGVMIGFALAVLIAKWSWVGVILGVCVVFVHHIVLLPVLCIVSVAALATACAVVRRLIDRTPRLYRRTSWMRVYGSCLVAIALGAWIETSVTPLVLQSVVPWAIGS